MHFILIMNEQIKILPKLQFSIRRLSPRIIPEQEQLKQQSTQLLIENNNSQGVYILHNAICDLFGENVYIIKYVTTINDITIHNSFSLIPLFPWTIIYIFFCPPNINIIDKVYRSMESFLYYQYYYDCPLNKMITIIQQCINQC